MQNRDIHQEMSDLLGVGDNPTLEEVKKAFKKLALEKHPDKVQEKLSQQGAFSKEKYDEANEKFKEISNAYQYFVDYFVTKDYKNNPKEFQDFFREETENLKSVQEFQNYIDNLSTKVVYEISLANYSKDFPKPATPIKSPEGYTLEQEAERSLHDRAFKSTDREIQQEGFKYFMQLAEKTKKHNHLMDVASHLEKTGDIKAAIDRYKEAATLHNSAQALKQYLKNETNQQEALAFLETISDKYPGRKDLFQFYENFEKETRAIASPERRQFLFLQKYAEFVYSKEGSNKQTSTWLYEEAVLHPAVKPKEAQEIIDHLLTKGEESLLVTSKLETLAIIISKGNEDAKKYAYEKYTEISQTLTPEELDIKVSRGKTIGLSEESTMTDLNKFVSEQTSSQEAKFISELRTMINNYKPHIDAEKIKADTDKGKLKDKIEINIKFNVISELDKIVNHPSFSIQKKYDELNEYQKEFPQNVNTLTTRRGDTKFWKILDSIKQFFGFKKTDLGVKSAKIAKAMHSLFKPAKEPTPSTAQDQKPKFTNKH